MSELWDFYFVAFLDQAIIIAGGVPKEALMNLKLIVAILVITAVPVYAQAQTPKLTRADAQEFVKFISGDEAKIRTYCEIGKLGEQIEEANAKKDKKTADELSQKMKELEKKLGPEYAAFMEGLQDINPESDDGADIEAALRTLERSCTKE
jgi:hypothetical protein